MTASGTDRRQSTLNSPTNWPLSAFSLFFPIPASIVRPPFRWPVWQQSRDKSDRRVKFLPRNYKKKNTSELEGDARRYHPGACMIMFDNCLGRAFCRTTRKGQHHTGEEEARGKMHTVIASSFIRERPPLLLLHFSKEKCAHNENR